MSILIIYSFWIFISEIRKNVFVGKVPRKITMANTKVIAAVVVVIIVVAAAGAVVLLSSDSESRSEEINLVLGLEQEGSGLFINEDDWSISEFFEVDENGDIVTDDDGNAIYNAAGWGGKIIAVPTASSVQFYQIKTIVESYLADESLVKDGETYDYTLKAWSSGSTLDSDEVGYIVIGSGAADNFLEYYNSVVDYDLGISWYPQVAKITDQDRDDYETPFSLLATTNLLFPDQTCCVLYANASYVSSNYSESLRTVWAFKEAIDWINDALAAGEDDPDNEDYQFLLEITAEVNGEGFTTDEVVESLKYVTYLWGYDSDDPLSKLKEDIATQTEILDNIGGQLDYSVQDLGYDDYYDYASDFVDDSLIVDVLALDGEVPSWSETSDLSIAIITQDMHNIATYIAYTLLPGQTETFFEQAGLNVTLIQVSGSGAVLTALKANEADFGIAAQPAMIIDNINAKLTTAD